MPDDEDGLPRDVYDVATGLSGSLQHQQLRRLTHPRAAGVAAADSSPSSAQRNDLWLEKMV